MKQGKVKIKDVAEYADVSISTVSRVLNKKKHVSDQTIKKVLEAVDELGYRPNKIARGLRTQKTGSIGLIIPDITNEFFSNLAKAIEKYLTRFDYNLLLCNTDENSEEERRYIKTLIDKSVDGIIFISSGNGENMKLFPEELPVVAIDRKPQTNRISFVTSENKKGGWLATRHLIENGCSNIIMIKDEKKLSPMIDRLEGYKQALKEYNIEFEEKNIFEIEVNLKSVKELLMRIHQKHDFDGIFAGTDIFAIGAVKILIKLGYKIPEEIQIIGFDNIPTTGYYNPSITTISQSLEKMGEKSADMIVNMIENNIDYISEDKSQIMPVKLIKRDTTR
ncbi:MAG: LacI family DNA-binding transcriptional regulator [bacterium]